MAWQEGLEGTALDIAATEDSPLRVMAGPGTGKTFAMKRRVMRLLQEETDPRRISPIPIRLIDMLLLYCYHAIYAGCSPRSC